MLQTFCDESDQEDAGNSAVWDDKILACSSSSSLGFFRDSWKAFPFTAFYFDVGSVCFDAVDLLAAANTAESLSPKNQIAGMNRLIVQPECWSLSDCCLCFFRQLIHWLTCSLLSLSEDDLKPPPYSECANSDEADAPRPSHPAPLISEGGDSISVNEAPPPYTPSPPTQLEGPVSHSVSQSESRSA